mmetsp:Transcript_8230/g.10770  ORF Transcript_8230/g.10770 Transcript_8230/m.10770 type:complete len:152 (-) Transcript_8230:299-754(-)
MAAAAASNARRRPRQLGGCVGKLAREVLGPEIGITKEAMDALVTCHQAFLSQVSRGLTESQNEETEEGDTDRKRSSRGKQASAKNVLEKHCVEIMDCGDLWEDAIDMQRKRKRTENISKNKRKKVMTEDMIAEQERLFAASKQKAMDQKDC